MQDPSSSTRDPARTYEAYQVPALLGPFANELVARAAPQPGERVLDLACGTGIVGRRLAPLVMPGGHIDALDLNPHMLDVARDVAHRENAAIVFHEGTMEALPFADETYDLVTCQQGLQFVPDRAKAVQEMRRVLRPGGRAVVSCWSAIEHNSYYVAMASIMERHLGEPVLENIFQLSDADALRALFVTAGFTDVRIEAVRLTARYPQPDHFVDNFITSNVASILPMQGMTPAAQQQLIAALTRDIHHILEDYMSGDEIHSPRETHIAIAHA